MERGVAIIGVGMEKSGKSEMPSWKLFAHAATKALEDAQIDAPKVQELHLGNVYSAFTEKQTNMAPLALSTLGIGKNIPSTRYEAACASSSIAFRQGYINVLSGVSDIVLVGGTERLRAIPGSAVQEAMASSMDISERNNGLTFAAYWAYVAKSYARKYRLSDSDLQRFLAAISIKNHYHGAFNKLAHFQKEVSLEDVLNSTVVAPPIKIMDCCPFSDGAAALVLACGDIAKESKKPIWVVGSGQASGELPIADISDLSSNPAIRKAAEHAYKQAKIAPGDIDVAELHDCVNIHEVICLEETGLYREGRGIFSAEEAETYFDGIIPVSLSGGLKSRGHPVGATGAYQLCELAQQLRGDFEGKRSNSPEIGMSVNVGGTGAAVTVHILMRKE